MTEDMEKERFKALLEAYENGRCTPEEKAYVESWFLQAGKAAPELDSLPDYDRIDGELRKRLDLQQEGGKRTVHSLLRSPLLIAASLFLILSAGIVFYLLFQQPQAPTLAGGDDISPGGNRATLHLSNGQHIDLNEDKTGIVMGTNITYDDGTPIDSDTSIAYARLTTPRGGQYQVTLPDGSRVWLNAESSLDYPVAFSGNERKVLLSGEAYFDVMADATKPFIVSSEAQNIEVLGTRFNVNAYGDVFLAVTTLLSGSVKISSNRTNKEVTLNPGEQATLSGNRFQVQAVSADDYAAWKDGLIVMSEADLPTIARQLERWYDVEFDTGNLDGGQRLNGEVPRTTNLSGILEVLEINTGMKFKIEGRRIIAKKE